MYTIVTRQSLSRDFVCGRGVRESYVRLVRHMSTQVVVVTWEWSYPGGDDGREEANHYLMAGMNS